MPYTRSEMSLTATLRTVLQLIYFLALDLTKALDKMNHDGLFIRLIQKHLPNVLYVLENWFAICSSCVKWGNTFSCCFTLASGIRQGGVLSPFLFAIYIDGLVDKVSNCPFDCFLEMCAWVFCCMLMTFCLLRPLLPRFKSCCLFVSWTELLRYVD